MVVVVAAFLFSQCSSPSFPVIRCVMLSVVRQVASLHVFLCLGGTFVVRPDFQPSGCRFLVTVLVLSGTVACLAGAVVSVRRQAKTFVCESLVKLADCCSRLWGPVLLVCSARARALVPCLLSALPPEVCSVADALAEGVLTTCRQCGVLSSVGTAPQLLSVCGCGVFCHFALHPGLPVTVTGWPSFAALPLQLICSRDCCL